MLVFTVISFHLQFKNLHRYKASAVIHLHLLLLGYFPPNFALGQSAVAQEMVRHYAFAVLVTENYYAIHPEQKRQLRSSL